jgi:multidrug resistance protein, MATE family
MQTQAHLPLGFRSSAFLRLALPMIVSRAGLAAMGIADGIMVARYESREFACLSLAEGTLGRLLDIGIAFLIGGLLLVPRHFARGDSAGARTLWLRTVPVALALGAAGLAAGLCGKLLLALMGQKPELAAGAAPVMAILGAGYPAALLAISAAVYLEGINRPRLVAACVVAANLMNLLFNWLFIAGHFGIPAMGARGSALSTTIVRCVLGIVLGTIAWRRRVAWGANNGAARSGAVAFVGSAPRTVISIRKESIRGADPTCRPCSSALHTGASGAG